MLLKKNFLAALEAKVSEEEGDAKFFDFLLLLFSQILKITVFTLLLAISKRFKLQEPDCAHFVDFLKQINFFF